MSDLARRAVACSRWRWMMGMRDNQGRRVSSLGVYPTGIPDGDSRVRPDNSVSRQPILPDLTDPATIGCLLALVREAWGLPKACVIWNADKGRVHDPEMDWAQGDDNDPDVIALLNRYSWMVKGLGQTDEWLENTEGRVSPEIYQHVVRDILGHGASEAEALVNALEGAP